TAAAWSAVRRTPAGRSLSTTGTSGGDVRRVRLADLLASAEELAGFSALLTRGGVAAVPTETFYGLAADPTNEGAVSRIFEIKGRDDGTTPGGEPSTVIDATRDPIRVLRRGAFRWPETRR